MSKAFRNSGLTGKSGFDDRRLHAKRAPRGQQSPHGRPPKPLRRTTCQYCGSEDPPNHREGCTSPLANRKT